MTRRADVSGFDVATHSVQPSVGELVEQLDDAVVQARVEQPGVLVDRRGRRW